MAEGQRQIIYELLEAFDTAMLITHGDNEVPHARPMALASVEPNCDVWFFTGRGNAMIHEMQNDQYVLIVCQGERNRFVSLTGRAELVVDRRKAQQLWHESYAAWFPGGVEDPQLVLIHVHAEDAEYWDERHPNGLRHSFQVAGSTRNVRPQTKS
jgi:general stress protein 26